MTPPGGAPLDNLSQRDQQQLRQFELMVGALDASLFRVSTTKLHILQRLGTRSMTATEISKAVSVHRSAVHRHLRSLTEAGLVARIGVGRATAYGITPLGRRILEPAD